MQFVFRMILFFSLYSITNLTAFEVVDGIKSQSQIQNQEFVIDWAQKNLPQTGILKENAGGFVYLKVDDGYINQLFPLLDNPAYRPPPFFRRPDSPGAHISVVYVEEREQTGKIEEIGQKFAFKIASIAYVPAKTRENIVLEVISPELEKLRMKYGLSPKLKGHNFHITIAKKKRRSRES